MNCTFDYIAKRITDIEKTWLEEKFACSNLFELVDFIYIYIFKLKKNTFNMMAIILAVCFVYVNAIMIVFENFLL